MSGGILGSLNQDRATALGQFGQLSGLASARDNQNKAIARQESSKRKSGLMSGAVTMGVGMATATPIAIGMGGLQIIGSLF